MKRTYINSVKLIKRILIVSCAIFIVIQFIRPWHNENVQVVTTDISQVVTIPDTVFTLLRNACYDCHSNNTIYPWYSNIQPVGWFLADHIKEGKKELNFNEFANYTERRKLSKLDEIANNIKDNIMPLSSYKMMHKNARLSTSQKETLITWAHQTMDKYAAKN